MYCASSIAFDFEGRAFTDPPRGLTLGEDGLEIRPSKRPCSSLDYIVVVAAAPSFRAFTRPFQGGVEDGAVKRSHCLADLAVFLGVDEVANAVSHLTLCFLNEHCLTQTHISGTGLCGDGGNVSGYKSVVRGGGDDGIHCCIGVRG